MNSPEAYYLHIAGAQKGPYTVPQIDHLVNSGLVAQETLYWREGLEQWEPVTRLVALREKPNRWKRTVWVLAALLLLAVPVRIFGPVVVEGWQEANQHSFTAEAAYWRARDVVRYQALPQGALVEFDGFSEATVEMRPPDAAQVMLRGTVIARGSKPRAGGWDVAMRFDARGKDWSGLPEPAAVVAP